MHPKQALKTLRAEHDLGMCLDDCHICETEAYALNAQFDCAHGDTVEVVCMSSWEVSVMRVWCAYCGKDLK